MVGILILGDTSFMVAVILKEHLSLWIEMHSFFYLLTLLYKNILQQPFVHFITQLGLEMFLF